MDLEHHHFHSAIGKNKKRIYFYENYLETIFCIYYTHLPSQAELYFVRINILVRSVQS